MESVKTTVRILYDGNIKEKDIKLRSFSIGRSSKDDITLDSDRVSRAHVKVKISSGQILICNNHATNGTFLNGTPLPPAKWYKFKEGATLNLGGSKFDVQLIAKSNVVPITSSNASKKAPASQDNQHSSNRHVQVQAKQTTQEQPDSDIVFSLDEKEEYDEAILKNRKPEIKPKKAVPQKADKKQAVLEELEEQSKQLLEQESKELEEHLEQLHSKEEALQEKIDKAQEKLEDLQEKLTESKTNLEELDDNLIHTHEKFLEQETYFKNKQQANKELIKEIDERREEHEKLIDNLDRDTEKYEILQTDIKHSKSQLDKTERQIEDLKSEQSQLETEIVKLSTQKEDLELNIHQQNILIDRQKNESKSYERQIESTLEELRHINERETKASDRINELYADIRTLEKSKSDYIHEIDKLHAERENVTTKLIETQRDLENTKLELEKNERDLEVSKQEIINQAQKTIQQERDAFEKEIEVLRDQEELSFLEKRNKADELLTNAKDELEAAESEFQKTQDEIKELKTKNQYEISSLLKEAQNESNLIKRSAQDKANQIEANAREKENSIIESAKQKAQEELERQKNNADMLIQQAEIKVEQLHNEGQKELQVAKDALKEEISQLNDEKLSIQDQIKSSEQLLESLNESYQQKEDELQKELDEKDKQIQEKMAHAKERNIEKMNADIEQEREEKTKELHAQLEKTRQEISDEKSRARENLAKMRASELEQIRQMRAQEKAEIERNKKENIDALSEGIEALLKNEIVKAQKNNVTLTEFYVQTDHIKDLVKESLTTDQSSSKPLLERLNPYGAMKRGQSVKVTRNVILGSIASILILTSFFVFPSFYKGISNAISSTFTVDKTAEDLFIQDLRNLREQQADLQLEKSPGYKDSYVDNILYTTNFEKVWLSDEFYKKWVVKLDEVASMELGLRESMMMKFISIEFRLMQELVKLRAQTTRDLFDKHVVVMRELEYEKRAEMVEALGGEDNLEYILLAQKRFFDDFIENNPQVQE